MNAEDMVFVLDGVLGQVEMARAYYEQRGLPTLPLDSMAASLLTARALAQTEAEADAAPVQDGPCQHPADMVKKQLVGGGNYFLMCQLCNEMIEQSGAD